jgi:hypothetical protein
MLGVTLFGLFLTPVFYVILGSLRHRFAPSTVHTPPPNPAPEGVV